MDCRDNKARDFVAAEINMREDIQKRRLVQMKWLQKYEWLLKEHDKLRTDIKKLREEKCSISADSVYTEQKSCLPAPITTNAEYGWLAAKPDFHIEKYKMTIRYPSPFTDVIYLRGNVPSLAPGKGFIR